MDVTAAMNFRTAFCRREGCPDSEFEKRMFWRGLYRHAVPPAVILRWISPRFFREDHDLIRNLASDASMEEVYEDIERFQYGNRIRPNWIRTGFRIHLSPKRIARVAQLCLVPQPD